MVTIASGRFLQIDRCLGVNPGILLQIMFDGRATTDETDLQYKAKI